MCIINKSVDDFVNNVLFVYMVIKPSFKYLKNKKNFGLLNLKLETLLYLYPFIRLYEYISDSNKKTVTW